jgi:hypothetical protein
MYLFIYSFIIYLFVYLFNYSFINLFILYLGSMSLPTDKGLQRRMAELLLNNEREMEEAVVA